MSLELVDAGTDRRSAVTVTLPAVHLCPFKDEVDEGTATVSWRVTGGKTLELHSLRAHLDGLDEWWGSHEAYTADLREHLRALGLNGTSVETTWDTAGGQVTVTCP